jgi:hypothetical protein
LFRASKKASVPCLSKKERKPSFTALPSSISLLPFY